MASEEETKVCTTHLIDDDGQLLEEKDICRFLLSSLRPTTDDSVHSKSPGADGDLPLRTVGVQYHVVGVFGCQSSGKSSLLNKLFDTRFQTMDETQRRGQTTKGAFMARMPLSVCPAEDAPPLFVLDFEGTDGFERGEDQSFERQLSLFALSVADTLIINMWAVDVGRFNAANMNLLRTIFEVNLQLFAHEHYAREEKPTLLIVLRDFTEPDPSHHIKSIHDSFEKIWSTLVKPEAFRESSFEELFELRYRCLPHYKLQRTEFDASIVDFRSWFIEPSSEHYLFADRAAMFRGVPLDGLAAYLASCWSVICQSKDLDIPTQREMLARHRCFQLRHAAVERFAETCRGLSARLECGELVPRLSGTLEEEINEELREYSAQTRLYAPHVVSEFSVELEEELVTAEMQLVEQYAKTIAAVVIASLDTSVGSAVDGVLQWLVREAQALPLVPAAAGVPGADETVAKRVTGSLVSTLLPDKEKCREVVQNFWARLCLVLESVMETLRVSHAHTRLFGRFAAIVDGDSIMCDAVIVAAMGAVHQKVRLRFASMAENASDTAHQVFEQALTHAKDGTVRFFATATGLQKAEPYARQAGLELLGCLLYYRLRLTREEADEKEKETNHATVTSSVLEHSQTNSEKESDVGKQEKRKNFAAVRRVRAAPKISVRANTAEQRFFLDFPSLVEMPRYPSDVLVAGAQHDMSVDSECVMLSEQAVQRAFELFTQKSEFTTQLYLRNIESGKQSLPAWVFPALLVLGWNELWYVLTSPLLLILIILVAVIFFQRQIKAQWEALEESGPAWLAVAVRNMLTYAQNTCDSFMPARDSPLQSAAPAQRYRDPTEFSDLSVSEASGDAASSTLRRRKT